MMFEKAADGLQQRVAGAVAMAVVEIFEIVDIEHQQAGAASGALGPAQFPLQRFFHVAAVYRPVSGSRSACRSSLPRSCRLLSARAACTANAAAIGAKFRAREDSFMAGDAVARWSTPMVPPGPSSGTQSEWVVPGALCAQVKPPISPLRCKRPRRQAQHWSAAKTSAGGAAPQAATTSKVESSPRAMANRPVSAR